MKNTILVVCGSLIVVYLLIFLPMFGLHINTGNGTHVGFVTATEKSGLVWKTGTAYIKTDLSSSQEDAYCVIDDQVLEELKEFSIKKEKVQVGYIGFVSAGFTNCNGEGSVIVSVSQLAE